MEQNLKNNQNEFLWTLLANPANDAHLYAYDLKKLVNDFPQSGILQALLAHASDEKNLKQASVYFNPRSLFKLINAPSTFMGVPHERIVIQAGIGTNGNYQHDGPYLHGENLASQQEENPEASAESETAAITELKGHAEEEVAEMPNMATPEPEMPSPGHQVIDEVSAEKDEHAETAVPEQELPAVYGHNNEISAENGEPSRIAIPEAELPPVQPNNEVFGEKDEHTETTVHEQELSAAYEQINEISAEEGEPSGLTIPEAELPPVQPNNEVFGEKDEHTETTVHEQELSAAYEQINEISAEEGEPSGLTIPEAELPPVQPNSEVFGEKDEHTETTVHEQELPAAYEQINEISAEQDEPSGTVIPDAELHPIQHSDAVSAEKDEHAEATAPEAGIEQPFSEVSDEAVPEKEEPAAIIDRTGEEEHPEMMADTHGDETSYKEPGTQISDDIDETFDEIVGIEDINFEQPATRDKFFSFDQEFGAHINQEQEENEQPEPVEAIVTGAEVNDPLQGSGEHQDVAKYNDEKMPYTFMWWLDKTRKEHTPNYQPYLKSPSAVQNKRPKKITDELQQQYFENIFHITSVEELDKSTAPARAPYNIKRREQVIIERFIKEEPQIKPQSSDKLDNENKAKKSSEDRDELVTETLAGIYSDQMLYHKAIASYKKLMLKFPEKSRYFAEKIEQLEKKTN